MLRTSFSLLLCFWSSDRHRRLTLGFDELGAIYTEGQSADSINRCTCTHRRWISQTSCQCNANKQYLSSNYFHLKLPLVIRDNTLTHLSRTIPSTSKVCGQRVGVFKWKKILTGLAVFSRRKKNPNPHAAIHQWEHPDMCLYHNTFLRFVPGSGDLVGRNQTVKN